MPTFPASIEKQRPTLDSVVRRIHDISSLPHVALEIMRYHEKLCDPCSTYEGLLAVLDELDGEEDHKIGICWDMGHTRSSIAQGKLSPETPEAFLARVVHTHLHDVGPNGDTHWPLVEGTPVAQDLGLLKSVGFDGVLNLELLPQRWPPDVPVRQSIVESIAWLQRVQAR